MFTIIMPYAKSIEGPTYLWALWLSWKGRKTLPTHLVDVEDISCQPAVPVKCVDVAKLSHCLLLQGYDRLWPGFHRMTKGGSRNGALAQQR